ncbi:zinc finger protein-domain-containing protein [Penicillium hispanicum]|uniref:zinc finger protein-domain-containing protein n=1 Tax=Penicillium hispanicum TaxID=1080232 RepID=UPI00253F9E18|nr:zinc finger protein-domain-containing protein [Penicillium hispanicum]KAJ5585229.1 zinc finger protein-domain-containing protein [Penicillium hispanicum]
MSSRRFQDSSEESAASKISSSLPMDINLTNQLSALLDQQRNETLEQHLDFPDDISPSNILVRVLSPDSVISTASSFTNFNQGSQTLAAGYRIIGFGQCGLIFERPGRDYVVKLAMSAYMDALWTDLVAHLKVWHAFNHYESECRVPRVFSYVPENNQEWWKENQPFFIDAPKSATLPAMALITERILPLPKIAREALITKYCPQNLQATASANPTNRDCLARIYLGRRRPAPALLPPNFTLRNFNLCLDQMIELGLPIKSYAVTMGKALAVIHWAASVDGYDIEFVLGSEGDTRYSRDLSQSLGLTAEQLAAMPPHTDLEAMIQTNFKRRTTRMWVLDFNLCNSWEPRVGWEKPEALIPHLVLAFFENDPYYPLPLMEDDVDKDLWESFAAAYLTVSNHILTAPRKDPRLTDLPAKFLNACVSREKESLSKGLGHGHREHKD